MGSSVPAVKISDNTHSPCIRCPHCKVNSLYAIYLHRMCAENIIKFIIDSCLKALKLRFKNLYLEVVCIGYLFRISIAIIYKQFIRHTPLSWNKKCKISGFIDLLHIISLILTCKYNLHSHCSRLKGLKKQPISRDMLS